LAVAFLAHKIDAAAPHVHVAIGCQRDLQIDRIAKVVDPILEIEAYLQRVELVHHLSVTSAFVR
jgi:hypothetical protein